MDSKFQVGDVVMFFIGREGKLVEPPQMDDVTDKMLYEAPFGTVISVESGSISIRTEENTIAVLSPNDLKKVWFLNGSVNSRPLPKHRQCAFFGFTLPKDLSRIANIRSVGDE